ncbi:MAG: hypothetical protein CBHOC_1076 [uncultured Caballeronia sp.]|nr:MAG: hypothetical protein CBHOC_1076 [uncultured Caballeronia sp.]
MPDNLPRTYRKTIIHRDLHGRVAHELGMAWAWRFCGATLRLAHACRAKPS